MVQNVLQPGEVRIARRRNAELPAPILAQPVAAPVRHIERRIGEHVIGAQVRQFVAVEAAVAVPTDVGIDPAHRQVHHAEPPSRMVRFLTIDSNVADASPVVLDELFGLHEHAARPAARVVYAPIMRLQHLDHRSHDRARRVELSPALAFCTGELAEEVFIDAAEHVAALPLVGLEADAGDKVDQLAQHDGVERRAGVVLRQHAFERRVHLLDLEHRLVDQLSDTGLLGAGLEVRPARGLWHPEDVVGPVFVLVLDAVRILFFEFGTLGHEAIGNMLEEDQAEDDVLVIGRLHIGANLVRRLEQFGFETEVAALACFLC